VHTVVNYFYILYYIYFIQFKRQAVSSKPFTHLREKYVSRSPKTHQNFLPKIITFLSPANIICSDRLHTDGGRPVLYMALEVALGQLSVLMFLRQRTSSELHLTILFQLLFSICNMDSEVVRKCSLNTTKHN
jgi:hypothetical protein